MLRQAVTLDAAMTAGEALRRLALHGYWLNPRAEVADEYLRGYVDQVKELAKERQESRSGPAREAWSRRIRSPEPEAGRRRGPDPAKLTVEEVAALLAQPLADGRVAIRRQDGITIFWYALPIERVLHQLSQVGASLQVLLALDLHESDSVETLQLGEAMGEDSQVDFEGVVLHGGEMVGVAERGVGVVVENRRRKRIHGGTRAGADRGLQKSGGFAAAEAVEAAPAEVRVFPSVEAPQRVTMGQAFDVTVGLARVSTPEVATLGEMVLRGASGATTINVDVQVVADGFDVPTGGLHRLVVQASDPTAARVVVPLVPLAQSEPVRLTSIAVHYFVNGVACGMAARHIVVERAAGLAPPADPRGASWLDAQPPPPALDLAGGVPRPDVEIDITKPDGGANGNFLCTIRNAHGVDTPEAFKISLGEDAATFAKVLIDQVRLLSGDSLVDNALQSFGRKVASKLPPSLPATLRAVAAKVKDRPLTLQLNSAEPYVPWELALIEPPIDTERPAFLAAQTVMGRWILGDSEIKVPPRPAVKIRAMAVMAGQYMPAGGLRRLPKAEAEVADLVTRFRALRIDADPVAVKALLDGSQGDGVQAIHFAGHGEVDPMRPGEAAIFLSSGKPLSPILFFNSKLGREHNPFIFLNACMVGAGGELLGDQGGFPGNCLGGGFSALVAPLWAVNDDVAQSFAKEFYSEALQSSRPVAEVLRDLRSEYDSNDPIHSLLAYVYYGNPHLILQNESTAVAALSR